MDIREYLSEKRIIFSINGNTKLEILKDLTNLFLDGSDIIKENNYENLVNEIIERENLSSTGMQEGVAIPHVKSEYVNKLAIAIGISKEGKEFQSLDGEKSKIFFLIVSPKDNNRLFMKALSKVAQLSMEENKIDEILATDNKEKIIDIICSLEDVSE